MYMSDPTILPRVQEYLEANVHEMYVDINALADELQSKYREYGKRKRSAFRASVNKAYSIVLRKSGLDKAPVVYNNDTAPKNADCGIDEGVDIDYDRRRMDNLMNKQLTDLYTTASVKKYDGNELIDISSDDSEGESISKETASKTDVENTAVKIRTGTYLKKRKTDFSSTVTVETTKKRRGSPIGVAENVTCNFKSIGGMDKTLEEVCKMILHMRHPEVYKVMGVSPPRGMLLHGPPGCGKTLLAKAIAGELKIPLIKVAAPELVAGVSGESEERLRKLFEQAVKLAPCVLFIDEIDAITPIRQNVQREMERRIVAQLLSCLDDLNENEHNVLVIGASNRPDSIDAALRRAGRFDREISVGIPDLAARVQILKSLASNLRLTEDFDFDILASYTPGYVGADLLSLTREAAMIAINRSFKKVETYNKPNGAEPVTNGDPLAGTETQNPVNPVENTARTVNDVPEGKTALDEVLSWLHSETTFPEELLRSLRVTLADFQEALKHVQPSAKREGFATIPDVTWNDIGSLRDIREELQMAIVAPVRHAKEFYDLGVDVPTGVLLCGPPGCGKTLLAKAIANEAAINFISVKGPELLNMYVGESERAVRVCFERARNSSPCVIFFDELDALCPKRSDSSEGSASRVVNQLLTEMDGVEGRSGVFLLAASNRPDIIDPAVLRPGRLDKILFVDLPSAMGRADILQAVTKNGTMPRLASDVNLEAIGKSEQCKGFTGADLAALVREASVLALKEFMLAGSEAVRPVCVRNEHFLEAFTKIRPSVSDRDLKHYERLRKTYSSIAKYTEVEEMEYS